MNRKFIKLTSALDVQKSIIIPVDSIEKIIEFPKLCNITIKRFPDKYEGIDVKETADEIMKLINS